MADVMGWARTGRPLMLHLRCVRRKVFTPVQACKAMLESYPFHCDVLSLANAVALTTRGSNAEGGQDSSAGASTPAPEEGVRPCLTHTVPAT